MSGQEWLQLDATLAQRSAPPAVAAPARVAPAPGAPPAGEQWWYCLVRCEGREEFPLPAFAARPDAAEAELQEIARAVCRRYLPQGAGRISAIVAGWREHRNSHEEGAR